MEKFIDARGEGDPLDMIRRAIFSEQGFENIVTLVDNQFDKDKLLGLAKSLNLPVFWRSDIEGYHVEIKRPPYGGGVFSSVEEDEQSNRGDWLLMVGGCYLGKEDRVLGEALMEAFIKGLVYNEIPPGTIVFYNGGVQLACRQSKVLESLCALEQKGVEIYSCAASVEYYQLNRTLCVGKLIGMSKIVEKVTHTLRVVNI